MNCRSAWDVIVQLHPTALCFFINVFFLKIPQHPPNFFLRHYGNKIIQRLATPMLPLAHASFFWCYHQPRHIPSPCLAPRRSRCPPQPPISPAAVLKPGPFSCPGVWSFAQPPHHPNTCSTKPEDRSEVRNSGRENSAFCAETKFKSHNISPHCPSFYFYRRVNCPNPSAHLHDNFLCFQSCGATEATDVKSGINLEFRNES